MVEVSRLVTHSTYIDNDNDDFLKINEYNIMFEENLIDNNENIVLGKNIIDESGLTRKRYIVDDNIGKDDYEQNDSNIFSSDINRVNDTDLTNTSNFMAEKIFEKWLKIIFLEVILGRHIYDESESTRKNNTVIDNAAYDSNENESLYIMSTNTIEVVISSLEKEENYHYRCYWEFETINKLKL